MIKLPKALHMKDKEIEKLYYSLCGYDGITEIPEPYTFDRIIGGFKQIDLLAPTSFTNLDPFEYIIVPNKLQIKSMVQKGEIPTEGLDMKLTARGRIKVSTQNDYKFSRYSYEKFFKMLSRKIQRDFPDILNTAIKARSKSTRSLATKIISCEWLIRQALLNIETESHFEKILNDRAKDLKEKASDPPEIYEGFREFYDCFLSGFSSDNVLIERWQKPVDSLKDIFTNFSMQDAALFPQSWTEEPYLTILKDHELPNNITELFVAFHIYITDKDVSTFRQAIHYSRVLCNYDLMKNFIRWQIPLLLYLINKTVNNNQVGKKAPPRKHELLLQLFQEVTGISNFNLNSSHSSNSYKRYSDYCRNFKKNIQNMNSKGEHDLIRKLTGQIDKIALTNFAEFARDYASLILHDPTLMPMSNLYLYR